MASLVYIVKGDLGRTAFYDAHINVLFSQARKLPCKAVFVAAIMQQDEPMPQTLRDAVKWGRRLNLGQLEIAVSEASQIELHEPEPSGAPLSSAGFPRSDAMYFGRNDQLGMLLQVMDPANHAMRRTGDAVAHTSIHHHDGSEETYFLLHGACTIGMRNVKTGKTEMAELRDSGTFTYLTVPVGWQHPVVAYGQTPSVMLIVTSPPNNSRNDHHYDDRPFSELFPRLIASHTQRK